MRDPHRALPELLSAQIEPRPVESLKPYPGNPRRHDEEQLRGLARSIRKFGFTRPIGIDEFSTILYGHGCLEAAKRLDMREVPTVTLKGLTDAEKKALVIADNRLAEKSSWDCDLLKIHFQELINLNFEIELSGFSMGEIDLQFGAAAGANKRGDATIDEVTHPEGPAVSALGDHWQLGRHCIICSDSRAADTYGTLLGGQLAQMVVTDPPYNVKIEGHARGRSRKKHREFAMASGEMSPAAFVGFLESVMQRAVAFSADGSIHYWFIDWRHLPELLRASQPFYGEWKNLLVWRKAQPGQGSFYRSQHELVGVFKAGKGPHINNFGLGSVGRNRTNVLDYSSGSGLEESRKEKLDMHPTVKPVALIADLMLDCSKRNGIVLDLFGGSGTTILAAEQTGRRARLVEIDPLYVDLTIRRWQKLTGERAVHVETGRGFDEVAAGAMERAQA